MRDIDKGFKNLSTLFKNLVKTQVQAGVFSDAGSNPKSGESIVEYALYNEYGTEHIPARPFMRITADSKGERWTKLMTDCFDKTLEGGTKNIEHDIGRVGEQMISDIQETISSNITPANAAGIIKRKKSSRTLIDTGVLRASISSRVLKG